MSERDRVVRWVLVLGALLALLAWHFVGPWPGLILGIIAVVIAAVAYRVEPPRIDLDGSPFLRDPEVRERAGSRTTDQ